MKDGAVGLNELKLYLRLSFKFFNFLNCLMLQFAYVPQHRRSINTILMFRLILNVLIGSWLLAIIGACQKTDNLFKKTKKQKNRSSEQTRISFRLSRKKKFWLNDECAKVVNVKGSTESNRQVFCIFVWALVNSTMQRIVFIELLYAWK